MVGVPALELGLQLFVHVRVGLRPGVERLVLDYEQARQKRVGLVGGYSVVHAHEYSSGATRRP